MSAKLKLSGKQVQEIIELYTIEQLSLSAIGTIYGVNGHTIANALKRSNVVIRPASLIMTREIELEIVEMYSIKKLSMGKIGNIYHITSLRVRQVLEKYNVRMRSLKPKLTKSDEMEIIKLYTKDGLSLKEIAKQYHSSSSRIHKILNSHNIGINTDVAIKHKYDMTFFQLDSDEQHYFFGFSLGDGCLTKATTKKALCYTLTLKDIDISVMQKICSWIGLTETAIKHYSGQKCDFVRLNLCGSIWQKDWSSFGLIPRKTYNPQIPDIEEQYLRPFILGLIDADGSVAFEKKSKSSYKPTPAHLRKKPLTGREKPLKAMHEENSIQLVGHPKIMDWVIDRLRFLGFDGNINTQIIETKGKKNKKAKWKRIRIQRKADVINLAKILQVKKYYPLLLERKWSGLSKIK